MIKFGTAGWRAIIGEEFTFANVKIVTQAIADYLNQESGSPRTKFGAGQVRHQVSVVIGYDTRFLAGEFGQTAACVLAGNGIKVSLSKSFLPTPVLAYQIIAGKYAGGINFTASHNPPEYQGMKFSTFGGLPAPVGVTKKLKKDVPNLFSIPNKLKKYLILKRRKKS